MALALHVSRVLGALDVICTLMEALKSTGEVF
jgi:hypothetical protein